MNDMTPISHVLDPDNDGYNQSGNPSMAELVEQRYSRRQALFGGVSAAAVAVFGGSLLSACGDGDADGGSILPTTVNAGQDAATTAGRVVNLVGTSGGSIATTSQAWTQVSGPTVTIQNANTANASFIAPAVSTATPITLRYSVVNASGTTTSDDTVITVSPALLTFNAVAKNLNDVVTVPAGYTVTVLYRTGDPLAANVPAYANDGSDTNFAQRGGDHHDGMSYFGLAATGNTPDPTNNTRGLLVMNHENINAQYLHPNGPTIVGGVRTVVGEVIKEVEAHGVAVVEITRGQTWSYVQGSTLNRRITPFTPTSFAGPVRGSALLRTAFSTAGTDGRGTINNCANGYMPWGNYTTCEENWAGYFRREAGDDARVNAQYGANGARVRQQLSRYGLAMGTGDALRAGNNSWATAAGADARLLKFNATHFDGNAIDGSQDFRNEPNQFGWVVEIDPFDPTSTPRKRTALGRMNHEGCWPGRTVVGVKPAFYMGDDAQNEYIYKFVSNSPWAAADATAANRLAIGDKYLDAGTLYVARFNADGSGEWLPLVFGTGPLTAANATYAFADQADVLTHARIAGDVLGATKMDRPEWTAVNPVTGEMYCTLTNNSSRTPANTDTANPRAYIDVKLPQGDVVNADPPTSAQATRGNANGHIIRLREAGDTTEATRFTWDIYAFGSGADLDAQNINLSGLTADNDFSSCDGLWFGRSSNPSGQVKPLLWIETDDGAYTDVTNCMLLAALPGTVGDGTTRTITNTVPSTTAGVVATGTQTTRVGAAPGTNLKRFLVGPKECEITGIDSTPDGRTIFVNIQHPGENGTPARPSSAWPNSQAGTAPAGVRPRSATIAITRDDGSVVGL